jgi:hypothetical protein
MVIPTSTKIAGRDSLTARAGKFSILARKLVKYSQPDG